MNGLCGVKISGMMPQLLQQMQNPSVQQLMSNPEALQAIMQVGGLAILLKYRLVLFTGAHKTLDFQRHPPPLPHVIHPPASKTLRAGPYKS